MRTAVSDPWSEACRPRARATRGGRMEIGIDGGERRASAFGLRQPAAAFEAVAACCVRAVEDGQFATLSGRFAQLCSGPHPGRPVSGILQIMQMLDRVTARRRRE